MFRADRSFVSDTGTAPCRTRHGLTWPLRARNGELGGLSFVGREVALDQRVRQLPLRPSQLDPVSLEPATGPTLVTQPLPLGGKIGDLLQQRLDSRARVPTPET
jgi:hypothetical protein